MSDTETLAHTYNTSLIWVTGEDEGIIKSGTRMPLLFGPPPEFNGTDTVWSPEHLLLASVSSCYTTTLRYFVKLLKLNIHDYKMDAEMIITKEGASPFSVSKIILNPHIVFAHTPAPNVIDNLLSKAKRYCIISNSVNAEIEVKPEISFY